MHNHDNHKENSWMIWAMMLCCLGPVLLGLFFGAGVTAGDISPWVVIGAVAMFAVLHFVMMKQRCTYAAGKTTNEADKHRSEQDSCH